MTRQWTEELLSSYREAIKEGVSMKEVMEALKASRVREKRQELEINS